MNVFSEGLSKWLPQLYGTNDEIGGHKGATSSSVPTKTHERKCGTGWKFPRNLLQKMLDDVHNDKVIQELLKELGDPFTEFTSFNQAQAKETGNTMMDARFKCSKTISRVSLRCSECRKCKKCGHLDGSKERCEEKCKHCSHCMRWHMEQALKQSHPDAYCTDVFPALSNVYKRLQKMTTKEVIEMRAHKEDVLERLASKTLKHTRKMREIIHPTVAKVLCKWDKKHNCFVEYNVALVYILLIWSKYPFPDYIWTVLEGVPMVGLSPPTGVYEMDPKLLEKIKKSSNIDSILNECEKVNESILKKMNKQDKEFDGVLWSATQLEQENGIMSETFEDLSSMQKWITENLPTRKGHIGKFLLCPRFAHVTQRPTYNKETKQVTMVSKTRPIDNAKQSGVNDAFVQSEKYWLPTLNTICIHATIAEFYAREDEKGELSCFALDEGSAYRSLACLPQDQALLCTAQRCPKTGKVNFSILHSMVFGAGASVGGYQHKGYSYEHICRCLSAVCMRYMDDFWNLEARKRIESSRKLMLTVAKTTGTLMTADKEQTIASDMTLIGTHCDFRKFTVQHTDCKLSQRCMELRNYLATDCMTSADAERQFSRTLWSRTMLNANEHDLAGIMELLRDRQFGRDDHGTKLYPKLKRSIKKLIEMYETSGPVKFTSIIPEQASYPQITYSDGMQEMDLDKALKTKENFGIGALLIDREKDTVKEILYTAGFVKYSVLKSWYDRSGGTLKRVIMGIELEALLQMLHNDEITSKLRGKHTIHYIDNLGAWSCLTRNQSRQKIYDGLCRQIHERLKTLKIKMYFYFVPSAQNVADIPSRLSDKSKNAKTLKELHNVLKGWETKQVTDL